MQQFVSDKQLAQRYGVDRSTIWRWVAKGILPKAQRVGPNTTRFDLAEIEERDARRKEAG